MVGGLVGDVQYASTNSYKSRLNHSYAAVKVKGETNVGGLVAGNSDYLITNSIYWDKEVSEQETSSTGTGKTTEEMKQISTFINWNFDKIWDINEANDYPRLRIQD